jgi:diacylglycerol kinase
MLFCFSNKTKGPQHYIHSATYSLVSLPMKFPSLGSDWPHQRTLTTKFPKMTVVGPIPLLLGFSTWHKLRLIVLIVQKFHAEILNLSIYRVGGVFRFGFSCPSLIPVPYTRFFYIIMCHLEEGMTTRLSEEISSTVAHSTKVKLRRVVGDGTVPAVRAQRAQSQKETEMYSDWRQ